jgi:hypothetical protein
MNGLTIFLVAATLFCMWNLFWGLRTGRTWLRGFRRLDRHDMPWNYWVAIGIWILFAAGFLAALISALFGLGLVSSR